jgi:translation initiation factor 2-alpha kinase 4
VGKYESAISKRLINKEPEFERSYGLWSPSRCDVYVASYSSDQLDLRLDVIGDLWRAGIASDLQYDDNRNMEEITADCLDQNIL